MSPFDQMIGSGGFQHVGPSATLTTLVEDEFHSGGKQAAYFFEVLVDNTQIKSITYKIGLNEVIKNDQSFMNRALPNGYSGSFRYPVVSITRNAAADEIKLWIQPL